MMMRQAVFVVVSWIFNFAIIGSACADTMASSQSSLKSIQLTGEGSQIAGKIEDIIRNQPVPGDPGAVDALVVVEAPKKDGMSIFDTGCDKCLTIRTPPKPKPSCGPGKMEVPTEEFVLYGQGADILKKVGNLSNYRYGQTVISINAYGLTEKTSDLVAQLKSGNDPFQSQVPPDPRCQ